MFLNMFTAAMLPHFLKAMRSLHEKPYLGSGYSSDPSPLDGFEQNSCKVFLERVPGKPCKIFTVIIW